MSRWGRWLMGFWIALAIWMSDRWVWMLPALIGVVVGTIISRMQRKSPPKGGEGLPPFELGSLLILVSFVYLYLMFFVFQLRRTRELLWLEESVEPPSRLLIVGVVGLSLVLFGLGAALIWKMKVPAQLSRLWERLLEER